MYSNNNHLLNVLRNLYQTNLELEIGKLQLISRSRTQNNNNSLIKINQVNSNINNGNYVFNISHNLNLSSNLCNNYGNYESRSIIEAPINRAKISNSSTNNYTNKIFDSCK